MKSLLRYPVTTFGLSPDMQRVHPAFGRINRGDVSAKKLLEVLEKYRLLQTDWGPSASHIAIQSDAGRFVVRLANQSLTFAAEDAPAAQAVPLAAAEIVKRLEPPEPVLEFRPPPPPVEPRWKTITGIVLLAAGLALIIFALHPILVPAPADEPPADVTWVTDPAELKTRQQLVVGIFATGRQAGDRHLTVSADGHIVFAEVGPRQSLANATDTFRIAVRDQRTCLVTGQSGVIEALDLNTLSYFGDTYRRTN